MPHGLIVTMSAYDIVHCCRMVRTEESFTVARGLICNLLLVSFRNLAPLLEEPN
jgi:hypothetical protein